MESHMTVRCVLLITENQGELKVHAEIPPSDIHTMAGQLTTHLECLADHLLRFKFTPTQEVPDDHPKGH